MASAGSITWDLIANSSKFVSELDKANKAGKNWGDKLGKAAKGCLLYTSPSPRDRQKSRMPSSA